jgi:hypothetical protein
VLLSKSATAGSHYDCGQLMGGTDSNSDLNAECMMSHFETSVSHTVSVTVNSHRQEARDTGDC